MRSLTALVLFLLAAPAPEVRYFHFLRPIVLPPQSGGQACIVVDPSIFAHASPRLADLRVFQGETETPYVVRSDIPVVPEHQTAPILNLGSSDGKTVFDAAMPSGTYTDVQLELDGQNFLAAVAVSGSQTQTGGAQTKLGTYNIFDLTRQRLGRSTVIHLPASDFRFLHFQIAGSIAPASVKGLSITHSPKMQPDYVTVAQVTNGVLKGRDTVFKFEVQAHTPVDRVDILPGQKPANFNRNIEIKVTPEVAHPANEDSTTPAATTMSGGILRVHGVHEGQHIDEEQLTVAASETFNSLSKWQVAIVNHDDAPIEIKSVRLEMLERKLCFDAAASVGYVLYYGDFALAAPVYDYASLFEARPDAIVAHFGPEAANPVYQSRPDPRPFSEKHPALLWVALILVILILGLVALRSIKAAPPQPS